MSDAPYDFTLDTRVSEALGRRPELRQLLPAFHPTFAKLNHPVLGKVMPRLVTLEQAARVAGVDAEALLAVCNLPGAPAHPGPDVARRMDPPPPWAADTPVVELDVRPHIAAGEEPFALIMETLRTVPEGQVLRLRAPFEPAPLVNLLGKRGWVAHVTWAEGADGDEHCVASFWRPGRVEEGDEADVQALLAERLGPEELDVRGLEPPVPLRLVLTAAEQRLPLVVRHQREPLLLYPRLEERGLGWTVDHDGDDVIIRIDRASEPA